MFSSLLKSLKKNIETRFEANDTEKFVDSISIELKTAIVESISSALEMVEGKYLYSVDMEDKIINLIIILVANVG